MDLNTTDTKQCTRQKCKRIRAEISEHDRSQASRGICSLIAAWHQFQQSDWILTYMPMRTEVDLTSLLSHYPHKGWIIPRILPAGRMRFHRYDPDKLILHKFGMLEPDPASPQISPQEIQLVLVPGLAYDLDGWRLGYGGGFYDRFLAEFKGVSVGVTFQKLILPSIPHQDHDIPMQYVVSEQELLNTRKIFPPRGQ